MVPESRLESTEDGLVPKGQGWFVLNARDAQWREAPGRGAICDLEGEPEFSQLGIHLFVLGPATRWRCTTGRWIKRISSCSPARRF